MLVHYLRAPGTGGIALEPSEVTTRVKIKKIRPRWLPDVESDIIEPANVESNRDLRVKDPPNKTNVNY